MHPQQARRSDQDRLTEGAFRTWRPARDESGQWRRDAAGQLADSDAETVAPEPAEESKSRKAQTVAKRAS